MTESDNDNNQTDATPQDHVQHHQPYVVLFIFGCCGVGAILRILLRKWADFVHDFKYGSLLKIPHVALLAAPGLVISTILTACLSFILPEIRNISSFQTSIYISLLFGSIISATDPVAVVALLKDLGNQKYLGTIIEGEALLNDGAAIVIFKIVMEMLIATTPYFEEMTGLDIYLLCQNQIIFGPLLGFAIAKVAGLILGYIYNDALAEITITLSFTYLTFYFGEWTKTSGVLAVVVFGLALDRAAITPTVDMFLHRFWEMLAYLANTLIFVIVGIQVAKYLGDITWFDVGYVLAIYVGITIIRAISILCLFPVMKRLGIEINWRHVLVMTWGGLRGAVGLTLAIYLYSYEPILRMPLRTRPIRPY